MNAHAPANVRFALVSTLLLAGCGSTVYASCGLWQLGALIGDVVDSPVEGSVRGQTPAEVPPAVAAVAAIAAPGRESKRPTAPLPKEDPALFLQAPERSRDVSEASEKAVPLVVEAASPEPLVPCDDIYVYIVSVVEGDPQQSAASLSLGKTSPARFRQPGGSIGEWEVVSINDDWSGVNPDVWLRKGSSLCRAELAGNPSRVHVPSRPPAKQRTRRRPRRR